MLDDLGLPALLTYTCAVSYPARLRALFWIALTNFVLPVIFNVVLLALIRSENSNGNVGDTITVIAVISVNVYVQIVSGLLATLWCHWGPQGESMKGERERRPMSTVKFTPTSALTSHVHVEVEAHCHE